MSADGGHLGWRTKKDHMGDPNGQLSKCLLTPTSIQDGCHSIPSLYDDTSSLYDDTFSASIVAFPSPMPMIPVIKKMAEKMKEILIYSIECH
jgi:hypothetical protein